MKVGDITMLARRRLGVTLTRWPVANTLSHHLRQVIEERSIDFVIDVGANDGGFVNRLRSDVQYDGLVASLEPAPAAYERLLASSVDDANWSTYSMALGSRRATSTLNVFDRDDFASFHTTSSFGADRFCIAPTSEVKVEVHTLDSQWDSLTGAAKNVLLKCDTQGHDLEVVRGMRERRPAAIMLELSMVSVYDNTPRGWEVMQQLDSLGYRISGMFPVSRDGLAVVEFDGVFVLNGSE